MYAALRASDETVAFLLSKGALPDIMDTHNRTALEAAIQFNCSSTIDMLARVFQNAKSQNFKVAVSQNWLLYQTKSLQKELGFFLQKCPFSGARK